MEVWDLYDENFNKLNKTAVRGDNLNDNEYHLVVNAWIINEKNEFLISQRSKNKTHPLMWECTGGSALSQESDIDACTREISEELGLHVSKEESLLVGSKNRHFPGRPDILRVYIFKSNAELKDITIQEEEVNDAMWASKDKILELYNTHQFEANSFFNEALNIKYTDF